MKKRLMSRKFLLKIFSLFASLFIWMYVVSSAEIEINKSAPIRIELPKGLAAKNEIATEAIFRFKGPGLFVRKFLEKDLEIDIKKDKYFKRGVKKYSIRLDQYKMKLPLGVELLSIEPRFLVLNLEKSMEKTLPVKHVLTANVNAEFRLDNLKVFPKNIKVKGPRSVVRKLTEIETKPIEVADVKDNGSFTVPVVSPDMRVSMDQSEVNISYTLQSKNIEFTYKNVPIIFQSVKLIKNMIPTTVDVKVYGEEKKIKDLNLDSIQVMAFVPKEAKGIQEIDLLVELPVGVELKEISSRKVKVNLE